MVELEGKKVRVINHDGNFEGVGNVIGCDYDVGITIVDVNIEDKHLLCLVGPSSPLWVSYENDTEVHSLMFNLITRSIEAGVLDYRDLGEALEPYEARAAGGASKEVCAFM